MSSKQFQIDFVYQDVPYVGIVRSLHTNGETWYTVDLESEDREKFLQLTLKPSQSALEDWDFVVGDEDAAEIFDKDLLTEIGDAIEKQQKPRAADDLD